MRLAAVVLAILLIAACPPRRARVIYVQPCPMPVAPVVVQSDPLTAPPVETALDRHLAEWEKKTASVTSVRAEIALKRTDAVFKKDTNYTGVVLCKRPNFVALRLDNTADKADYEAYIYNGKVVYVYNGVQKTITEVALPKKVPGTYNSMPDLLFAGKAKDMKERFDITLLKTDDHYIYLDIKPLRAADKTEFQHLRLALYGPGKATAKFAYLPAQVYVLKPNGDSESWKFTHPLVNIPSVDAKAFQFVEIEDKAWKRYKTGISPEPVKP